MRPRCSWTSNSRTASSIHRVNTQPRRYAEGERNAASEVECMRVHGEARVFYLGKRFRGAIQRCELYYEEQRSIFVSGMGSGGPKAPYLAVSTTFTGFLETCMYPLYIKMFRQENSPPFRPNSLISGGLRPASSPVSPTYLSAQSCG